MGLIFIWSCFVSCLLFLLFYVILRNLCSGTHRRNRRIGIEICLLFSLGKWHLGHNHKQRMGLALTTAAPVTSGKFPQAMIWANNLDWAMGFIPPTPPSRILIIICSAVLHVYLLNQTIYEFLGYMCAEINYMYHLSTLRNCHQSINSKAIGI